MEQAKQPPQKAFVLVSELPSLRFQSKGSGMSRHKGPSLSCAEGFDEAACMVTVSRAGHNEADVVEVYTHGFDAICETLHIRVCVQCHKTLLRGSPHRYQEEPAVRGHRATRCPQWNI